MWGGIKGRSYLPTGWVPVLQTVQLPLTIATLLSLKIPPLAMPCPGLVPWVFLLAGLVCLLQPPETQAVRLEAATSTRRPFRWSADLTGAARLEAILFSEKGQLSHPLPVACGTLLAT